ncbi:hypothetical protein BCT62_09340 [Vibrio splendidus]|nr:hypothetical protein BCT62_09340 [Vibrio splendidus]PMN28986.1 hypothetical protein BCT36_07160 [Vibrio splendidus]
MSVDKSKMINKIMDLFWIKVCDLTLIMMRISWDQNGYLFTGENWLESFYLDNYRLITVYV